MKDGMYYTHIYEYERLLMGQSQKELPRLIDSNVSEDVALRMGQDIAGHIWDYAVTELLGWTPQEAVLYMNDDIVKMLCLDKTLSFVGVSCRKNFHFPDYRFMLQYAFPDVVLYGDDDWALNVFKRCAGIEEYQRAPKYEYPKGFWAGTTGYNRAIMALNHVIDLYLSDLNIHELYEYFADVKQARLFLRKYALSVPLKLQFDNALEYLHEALRESRLADENYYQQLLEELYAAEAAKNAKNEAPEDSTEAVDINNDSSATEE